MAKSLTGMVWKENADEEVEKSVSSTLLGNFAPRSKNELVFGRWLQNQGKICCVLFFCDGSRCWSILLTNGNE